MPDIKVRCKNCGGKIFPDDDDEGLKCSGCARPVDEEGNIIPPKPAPPPDRYQREYHIPRSLRREGSNGSLH